MIVTVGIDIGSCFSKGVLLRDFEVAASFECLSAGNYTSCAEKIFSSLLEQTSLSPTRVDRTVATGFGAKQVAFADETKSDIACHTKAVFSHSGAARTIIDIGDLHTKAIRVLDRGLVQNFLLSGNCAGGSGRILQVIAKVLQLKLDDLGPLSMRSSKKIDFNTGCAVFAESEAISRVADGVAKEDLLAGLNRALAAQINSLAERIGVEPKLYLVGGGARNPGLVEAFKELRDETVSVLPQPQMSAALGAAMIATESMRPK